MKTESNITIKQVLLSFWNGVKHNKLTFFTAYISGIIANILSIIVPIYYKEFFDKLGFGDKSQTMLHDLVGIITTIAIIHLISWILWRSSDLCNTKMTADTMSHLRQFSFNYLIKHSYGFFANNFSGGLVQRINRFTRSFE